MRAASCVFRSLLLRLHIHLRELLRLLHDTYFIDSLDSHHGTGVLYEHDLIRDYKFWLLDIVHISDSIERRKHGLVWDLADLAGSRREVWDTHISSTLCYTRLRRLHVIERS